MNKRAVVYTVGADYRYKSLRLYASQAERAALPALGGTPVGNRWPRPRVTVEDDYEAGLSPDIWHAVGKGYALAMSTDVIERLEPFISNAAELLPLQSEQETGQVLFALNVLNPLAVNVVIDTTVGEEERMTALERLKDLHPDMTSEDYEGLLQDARDGELYPVLYPAFIEERLPSEPTLFKIDRFVDDVFLLDREDEGDTLLRRIEEFGLTGLVRTRIWSSDTGPEPLNLFRDV